MRDSCSRDCSQLVCILFVIGRIVCHITSKMGKTIAKLLCFGSFAGAWARHEGLRRLKPCQFQRTVYWHCECDKLRFQLLVVCSSWTRGHRANEPYLSRLQLANMKVSTNDGSDWKTFSVLLKPSQRNKKKNMQLVGGRSFPPKENSCFSACNAARLLLVGCLVELANKTELLGYLGSCLTFFGRTLHAIWKKKSCFLMFAPWLNDWDNERRCSDCLLVR